MLEANDFKALKIGIASPEKIRSWSYGEVLKPETIKNLKEVNLDLKNSKPYIAISQMLKLSVGMAVSMPKAALTAALTIPIFDRFLHKKETTAKSRQKIAFRGQNLGKIQSDFLSNKIAQFYNFYL